MISNCFQVLVSKKTFQCSCNSGNPLSTSPAFLWDNYLELVWGDVFAVHRWHQSRSIAGLRNTAHLGRIALPCVEHGRCMSVSGHVRNFSSDAIFRRRIYRSPQTFRRLDETLYVASPNAVGDGKRLRGVAADQNQRVPPNEISWSKERGRGTVVRCERRREIRKSVRRCWSGLFINGSYLRVLV